MVSASEELCVAVLLWRVSMPRLDKRLGPVLSLHQRRTSYACSFAKLVPAMMQTMGRLPLRAKLGVAP